MTYIATKNRGFTLIETLTYGVGLIIVLGGIVTFVYYLYDWYRTATIPTRADQMAISLINKISYDVRSANQVNDAASVFNNASGILSVTSTSAPNSTTTIYALENGLLKSKVNSSATTTESASDVWISGFYVRKLTTDVSEVVKIELSVDYLTRAGTTTETYNGLAVLRQSYQ